MRRMALSLGMLALASPALAQVARFDVTEDVPAFAGRSFGTAGPYRRITARATIALDPTDPHNAVIVDLASAPRNADGKVEATADVVILTPADPAFASGTMLLDVPNRGRKLAPELFDDSPQPGATRADQASDAGNGFLYGRGTTLVWVGWQGDIPSAPGQLAMQAPVLAGVTGRVREEFVFDNTTSPVTVTPEWKLAATPDLAVLVRQAWPDPRQTPAGLSVRAVDDQHVEITRPATGFDAGALYELTYTGRDPAVLGMGYAMTRDVATFLRRDTGRGQSPGRARQVAGGPGDPVRRLAIRALRPRLPVSRLQSGHRRPDRLRGHDAACRRRPAHGDQRAVRPARPQRPPSAGPGLAGGRIPVHLRGARRPTVRPPRRAAAALPALQ